MSSSHDKPDAVATGVASTQLPESGVMRVILDASAAKKNANDNIVTATVVAIPDLPELANAVWKEDILPSHVANQSKRVRPSRITQISTEWRGDGSVLFALNADGDIYRWTEVDGTVSGSWAKLPEIPDNVALLESPPVMRPSRFQSTG